MRNKGNAEQQQQPNKNHYGNDVQFAIQIGRVIYFHFWLQGMKTSGKRNGMCQEGT